MNDGFTKNKKVIIDGILYSNPLKLNDNSGKYHTGLILSDSSVEKLKKTKDEILLEKFGSKSKTVNNWLFRKGVDEEYKDTFEKYYILSKSEKPVPCYLRLTVDDPMRQLKQEEIPTYFYRGAHVALSIEVYACDKKAVKDSPVRPAMINSMPRNLLFLRDGEPLSPGFGSTEATDDEFQELTSAIEAQQDETPEEFADDQLPF